MSREFGRQFRVHGVPAAHPIRHKALYILALVPTRVVLKWPKIQIRGADPASVEVDGTREAETLLAKAAVHVEGSDDPVITSRIVVDSRAMEMDIGPAESSHGLLGHSILANTHGFVRFKPVSVSVVVFAVSVIGPVPFIIAIAVAAIRRRFGPLTIGVVRLLDRITGLVAAVGSLP